MTTIKPENHTVIHGWMITDLDLKGSELIIYAVIYGFTQNTDNQLYTGSLTYLADWANVSNVSAIRALTSLCEKGLIDKFEEYRNGVKFCNYRATNFSGSKETLGGIKKLNGGGKETLPGGGKETLPHNKDKDNKEQNKDNNAGKTLETVLSEFDLDEKVNEAIREFIKMRKLIKAPMTNRALILLINKLREMDKTTEGQIAILNQSIENSWKGIYEIKKGFTQKPLKGGWSDINRQGSSDDIYSILSRNVGY